MKLISIFLFSCAVVVIGACSADKPTDVNVAVNKANAPAATPMPSASLDELASGKNLYTQNCAGCHKDDGTGGEKEFEGKKIKPDNLTDDRRKALTDEKIISVMMKGVEEEGMPAFEGKLSEGEMRDVVKYIRVELQKMPKDKPAS